MCAVPGSCACQIALAPTLTRPFLLLHQRPCLAVGCSIPYFRDLGRFTHDSHILWATWSLCTRCLCLPTSPKRSGKPSEPPPCLLQALGLAADMSAGIMGKRTRRFAMYVNDGTVSSQLVNQISGLELHHAGWKLCLVETGAHHLLHDSLGCCTP